MQPDNANMHEYTSMKSISQRDGGRVLMIALTLSVRFWGDAVAVVLTTSEDTNATKECATTSSLEPTTESKK